MAKVMKMMILLVEKKEAGVRAVSIELFIRLEISSLRGDRGVRDSITSYLQTTVLYFIMYFKLFTVFVSIFLEAA